MNKKNEKSIPIYGPRNTANVNPSDEEDTRAYGI